ncbi:mercury resistance system periplasmic binding protein MerP [Castellaniella ginsengisoli]|uniref:mercury resistance system periplasmic binding protein MerP n=1 Tax=unclassified Castellaniella TaxID=2617606 RepID=UPI0022B4A9C2|nr:MULTISPECIES: mercury resistance system periplasmic binding protein MerP [unclassified Castellaniella]
MKKMLVAAALSILTAPAWAVPTTVTLSIPTMDCPVCPITVKKALTKVPGVSQAEISFEKRLATVTYESTKTSVDALVQATTNAGYPSILMEHAK